VTMLVKANLKLSQTLMRRILEDPSYGVENLLVVVLESAEVPKPRLVVKV
jgi:hypothetical protein